MRKTRSQKGITLIALIITIIVLLILAVVAIGAVQNDGIINYAKNARQEYGVAQDKENSTLGNYLEKLNQNAGSGTGGGSNVGNVNSTPATTIAEAQADAMLTKIVNSDVKDKYNNKITVPAGFKILVDNTTGYTVETIDVTKGIVIQDAQGNEFVWIPVGNVYYSGTEYKTITLGRYDFDYQTGEPTVYNNEWWTEDTEISHGSTYNNAIAKDIEAFISSANDKNGYYIARYEAGVVNYDSSKTTGLNSNGERNWTGYVAQEGKKLQLVSKKEVQVWNFITQNKASELSRNMYKNATTFSSDLVNSYAWDTAILFIQECGEEADASIYSFVNKTSENLKDTSMNSDKYCNIYDMSSNAMEFTTETVRYTNDNINSVHRGGWFADPSYCTCYRGSGDIWGGAEKVITFRSILYINN